jgi:HNH endonuclease
VYSDLQEQGVTTALKHSCNARENGLGISRSPAEGIGGPRGDALVSKLLKRLADRSASMNGGGGPLAEQRAAPESRGRYGPVRYPLPSAWVRMYVWRRDQGKCVRCGSQERVWFDYVIPVWEGGAITQQNIRLLCERCLHDKGVSSRRKRRKP